MKLKLLYTIISLFICLISFGQTNDYYYDTTAISKQQLQVKKYTQDSVLNSVFHLKIDKDTMLHGAIVEYYPDGTIKKQLNRSNKQYDGIQEVFYANSQLKTRVIYKDGIIVDSASWDSVGNSVAFLGFYNKAYTEYILNDYIRNHLQYPKEARRKELNGYARVKFIIEKDGSISNVAIDSISDPIFKVEAIRIIQRLPHWQPAIMDGFAVRSLFRIPIRFVISTPKDTKNEQYIKTFKVK